MVASAAAEESIAVAASEPASVAVQDSWIATVISPASATQNMKKKL